MVHNAIEYGMLEAYAEGFELLHDSDYGLDLPAVAALWGRGGVVRSWLLELLEKALAEDPQLEKVDDFVEDSGMGRWTVHEAVDRAVPAPVLSLALMSRFRSRQEASFAAKVVASLRKQFGGHAVRAPS
jgi:6-phosphogluconate dehydrogenase